MSEGASDGVLAAVKKRASERAMEPYFKLGRLQNSSPSSAWRSCTLPSAPISCLASPAAPLRSSSCALQTSRGSRIAPIAAVRRGLASGVAPPPRRGTAACAGRGWQLRASTMLPVTCEVKVEMKYTQEEVPEGTLELPDAAAFGAVANNKGLISICGFGSLLSEKSARYTFPNLLNFRVAVLPGFRRVFAHVAPVFLERGIANVATKLLESLSGRLRIHETVNPFYENMLGKEISSLSVEPCSGESVIVTVFEIYISEVPAFIEREHEFRFLAVTLFYLQGEALSSKAVICARYSDKEYREYRCQDDEEYHRRYGRFNIDKIWRDDILPCRVYLRHCVLAAKNLGQGTYDSFLDHTYLGDRCTTIRQYLATDEQIMQEEPPPLLRERYGG